MTYRIREIRENLGITQAELAEKAGLARATVWKLEVEDDVVTTTKTLERIADVLGVDLKDLFLPQDAR